MTFVIYFCVIYVCNAILYTILLSIRLTKLKYILYHEPFIYRYYVIK